jgi:hypothetical protein
VVFGLGSGNFSVAITKPLLVSGDDLVLNVNTGAGGVVRVEILNATDDPIPLFSDSTRDRGAFPYGDPLMNHPIPVVANSIAKTVQWHTLTKVGAKEVWQQYGLKTLRGQMVKLRFLMVGTKLYSYSFV